MRLLPSIALGLSIICAVPAWAQSDRKPERAQTGDRVRFSPPGQATGGLGMPGAPVQESPYVNSPCDKAAIRKGIADHAAEVTGCYQLRVNELPELEGKITVAIVIEGDGRVSSAQIKSATLEDPQMQSCLLARIRNWQFPENPAKAACLIDYPWIFKSKAKKPELAPATKSSAPPPSLPPQPIR